MRRWGVVVTAFYSAALLGLVVPGVLAVSYPAGWIEPYRGAMHDWTFWLWVGILVGGQAILLFLSVDGAVRKLKPRRHLLLSITTIAAAFGLLTTAAIYSLLAGFFGDDLDPHNSFGAISNRLFGDIVVDPSSSAVPVFFYSFPGAFSLLLVFWLFWGVIFGLYANGAPIAVNRLVGWLMKGSVLELLIAVPCHVAVRRREDCSAPLLSGYGIATGLAVMLMSFGPSGLFLYKKRLEQYEKPLVEGRRGPV
ncbi:MAG: hypothetical protein ND807_13350 [Vicinamibacterales bacterium]|nr:hypothetical protein [Vicinamibacterales bacterium]